MYKSEDDSCPAPAAKRPRQASDSVSAALAAGFCILEAEEPCLGPCTPNLAAPVNASLATPVPEDEDELDLSASFFAGHGACIRSCAFSEDGSMILSSGDDQTVRTWCAADGPPPPHTHSDHRRSQPRPRTTPRTARGPPFSYHHFSLFPPTIRRDVATGACSAVLQGHSSPVFACDLSPHSSGDAALRAVSAGSFPEPELRVWDVRSAVWGRIGEIAAAAIEPAGDGNGSSSAREQAPSSAGGARRGGPKQQQHKAAAPAALPAATACVGVLPGHTMGTATARFSPDGCLVASGGSDMLVTLWAVAAPEAADAEEAAQLAKMTFPQKAPAAVLSGHRGRVTCVGWRPDGEALVSGSWDYSLIVWDLSAVSADSAAIPSASGEHPHTLLLGHTNGVTGCCFSPDGEAVLSCSMDRTMRLWDTETGAVMLVFSAAAFASADAGAAGASAGEQPFEVTAPFFTACCFSRDGRMVASAESRGERAVRVWCAATGDCLFRLPAVSHGGLLSSCCIAFSPDSDLLVSGGGGDDSGPAGPQRLSVWPVAWSARSHRFLPPSLRAAARTALLCVHRCLRDAAARSDAACKAGSSSSSAAAAVTTIMTSAVVLWVAPPAPALAEAAVAAAPQPPPALRAASASASACSGDSLRSVPGLVACSGDSATSGFTARFSEEEEVAQQHKGGASSPAPKQDAVPGLLPHPAFAGLPLPLVGPDAMEEDDDALMALLDIDLYGGAAVAEELKVAEEADAAAPPALIVCAGAEEGEWWGGPASSFCGEEGIFEAPAPPLPQEQMLFSRWAAPAANALGASGASSSSFSSGEEEEDLPAASGSATAMDAEADAAFDDEDCLFLPLLNDSSRGNGSTAAAGGSGGGAGSAEAALVAAIMGTLSGAYFAATYAPGARKPGGPLQAAVAALAGRSPSKHPRPPKGALLAGASLVATVGPAAAAAIRG